MKNKIKVLQVIGSLNIGGAENMAMNITRFIDKNIFQCDYLVFGDEVGQYEEEAVKLGSKVIHIPSPNEGYLNYIRNLKKILISNKYDVVHAHTLLNNGLTLKVAYKCNIRRRISHSHSTDSGRKENLLYKIYKYTMKKFILKYATDYFACGIEAGEYLYGKNKFKYAGKIINNGILIENYVFDEKKRRKIRQRLKLDNQLVIGHIGRITSAKNHSYLIDIFYELSKKEANSKLIIVGDGELRPFVEKKISELGLDKKVILTGMISGVEDILQAIDMFVFPSLYEGFPVALIEAQASGVPCLVSDNISHQVRITDLVTFMSLEDHPNKWAEKIIELKAEKRTDRSQEMIVKGFDVYTTIRLLENIYEN